MMSNRWSQVLAAACLAVLIGCGGARSKSDNGNNSTTSACQTGADCTSGVCDGGFCGESVSCKEKSECADGLYCHFPSQPDPWVANTEGTCETACTSDESCGIIGQQCLAGKCYTNVSCNPSNKSSDCPPGEVCNQQSRSCSAPPTTCYFNDQCPSGWVCNTDNKCVDPDDVELGSCQNDTQCDSVAGCQGGRCACSGGQCRPRGGCTSDSACSANQLCNAGVCQNATSCADQAACTPFSLVCSGGYCKNPAPCGTGNTCTNGYECHAGTTPPGCFPPGTPECTRDAQCATGKYCDTFGGGVCKVGCRSSVDCVGQCSGQVPCNCGTAHACTTEAVGTSGTSCTSDASCASGTICAYNDPSGALTCELLGGGGGVPLPPEMGGGGTGDCSKACRQTCDILTSQVQNECPSGQTCGGNDAIMSILQQLLGGGGGSGSVCYPASSGG